jgi:hypothetical protein
MPEGNHLSFAKKSPTKNPHSHRALRISQTSHPEKHQKKSKGSPLQEKISADPDSSKIGGYIEMLTGLMAPGIGVSRWNQTRSHPGPLFIRVKEERKDLHPPLPSQVGNGFLLDGFSKGLELRSVELMACPNFMMRVSG